METALENEYAEKLRRQRSGGDSPLQKGPPAIASEALRAGGEGGSDSGDAGASWREMRQALNLKERAKEKLEEKVLAPAKAGTSQLLKWAWGAIIPSFGLSLIYINLHVFLHWVLGDKFFCKLGEEWKPQLALTGGKEIAESFGSAGKIAGIIEIIGLLMLDLAVILIIFIIIGVLVMLFEAATGIFGWLLLWI